MSFQKGEVVLYRSEFYSDQADYPSDHSEHITAAFISGDLTLEELKREIAAAMRWAADCLPRTEG